MPATTGTGGSSMERPPGPFFSALAARVRANHTAAPTTTTQSATITVIFQPEDSGASGRAGRAGKRGRKLARARRGGGFSELLFGHLICFVSLVRKWS